jgi:secreted trypsin-like serine protease
LSILKYSQNVIYLGLLFILFYLKYRLLLGVKLSGGNVLKIASLILIILLGSFQLLATEDPQSQIIKGNKDTPNYYSFVFSIDHCTAFLIHPNVLLTAAHCITSEMKRSNYLNVSNSTKAKLNKRIKLSQDILIHPKYKSAKYHDMAVIISSENIQQKFGVKFIPKIFWGRTNSWLSIERESPQLIAVGYGETLRGRSGTKRSVSLKFLKYYYDIKSNSVDLLQRWRISDFNEHSILPTTFTLSNSPEDTCNGDSGGPVLLHDLNGQRLFGITMGGSPRCGSGKSPSAYRLIAPDICWFKSYLQAYLGKSIKEYCE